MYQPSFEVDPHPEARARWAAWASAAHAEWAASLPRVPRRIGIASRPRPVSVADDATTKAPSAGRSADRTARPSRIVGWVLSAGRGAVAALARAHRRSTRPAADHNLRS